MGRGDPEPRLAAARLGVRRRPAQRRPDRHDPARRRRREGELVTQFAYGVLLARIPLFMFQAVQAALLPRLSRLAARGELGEFRAGLRAPADGRPRRRRRRHRRRVPPRPVRDRGRLRRRAHRPHAGHAGPRQRLLHGRAGPRPGRDRPQGPRPRRRSAGRSASSPSCSRRGCRATTCSAGSRSACSLSSVAAMVVFALALRDRLATGVVPDERFDDRSHHRHAAGDLTAAGCEPNADV